MEKLILGCGYLGRRVAAPWLAEGHKVYATTRNKEHARDLEQAGINPVICDVTEPATLTAIPAARTVVYCIGFDRGSQKSMHEVYVRGLENVLRALRPPERFLFVSSTGVYGQRTAENVDENAATEPADASGKIVLEAEACARRGLPGAIVLRFAGIYGPGRLLHGKALSAGEPLAGDPEKLLNLIHVDDGATAVLAAEARAQPEGIYNVCDDAPVRRQDFYRCLATLLNVAEPRFVTPAGDASGRQRRGNRRIINRRMHEELGVQLRYPSYREGLAAVAAAHSP